MDITPQFASTTNSDNQGSWSLNAATSVGPGFHTVLIRDEKGNEATAPLYVAESEKVFVVQQQTQTLWLDRVQAIIPPAFAYAILGLIFLLVLATLFVVWAGRRGSKRLAIVLAVIILLIAAAGAVFLNVKIGVPPIGQSLQTAPSAEQVDVRGTVEMPLDGQPVSGVDLTLGDTSIKTSGSGQFAFPRAHIGDLIRINHPLLRRAVAWRISSGGSLAIPFDPALYNALNTWIEAQRGPISDQQLVVTGAHIDQQAKTVKIDVLLGSSLSETFQHTGDNWIAKP